MSMLQTVVATLDKDKKVIMYARFSSVQHLNQNFKKSKEQGLNVLLMTETMAAEYINNGLPYAQ
jgi:hypothetical protein